MSILMSILFALLAIASLCFGAVEIQVDQGTMTDFKELADVHNDESYLPEFSSISRSIIGRADSQTMETLSNNIPATTNSIQPGGKQNYIFPLSALQGPKSTLTPFIPDFSSRFEDVEHSELRKRATDFIYYFSFSVCSQPASNSGDSPPQLQVFLSDSNPNADGTGSNPKGLDMVNGYTSFSDNTSNNVYIGIQAPEAPGFTGSYTYELVVSIDQYYTTHMDDPTLYFVDADNGTATFVSGNLTQPMANGSAVNSSTNLWYRIGPQFSVYVADQADATLNGLTHSYCALKNTTQPGNAESGQKGLLVETGITNLSGPALQQQFYVSGLQAGKNYSAAMGLESNYTRSGPGYPGGGGTLYSQVDFTTKTDGNCRIIYNLTFCPQINYAVPSNPNRTLTDLTNWYNNQTKFNYKFFQYALDQIACTTSSDSQYSLAVGCDDCRQAYTNWLCTVMSPRCHDYSSQKPYLHPRAMNYTFLKDIPNPNPPLNATYWNLLAYNSSRNPAIDTEIVPGPYKELLPCGDVCNKLVRACPAALGFGCPYDPENYKNSYGFEAMDGNLPQCNYPGKVVSLNGAFAVRPSMVVLLVYGMLLLALG